jgi:hypothetical protein
MNKTQSVIAAAVIGFLLIGLMTDWLSEAAGAIASVPWFVYLLVAGILYSGYKFVHLSREDHKADQEWIEQEGNVYIRRMEEEKERRREVGGGEFGTSENEYGNSERVYTFEEDDKG